MFLSHNISVSGKKVPWWHRALALITGDVHATLQVTLFQPFPLQTLTTQGFGAGLALEDSVFFSTVLYDYGRYSLRA